MEAAPGIWVHRSHIDDAFRKEFNRAKRKLLTDLPERIETAKHASVQIQLIADELAGDFLYRLFSPDTLATLICRYIRKSTRYLLIGDETSLADCRVAIIVAENNRADFARDQTHTLQELEQKNSQVFTEEDVDYAQSKEAQTKSSRMYYEWQEDFSRACDSGKRHENIKRKAEPEALKGSDGQLDQVATQQEKSRAKPSDSSDDEMKDTAENSRKAFADFKRQGSLEKQPDTDGEDEIESDFKSEKTDESSTWSIDDSGSENWKDIEEGFGELAGVGFIDSAQDNRTTYKEASTATEEWEQYTEDLSEFEETPSGIEEQEVQTEGRLTREQRARQVAIEVGRPFGWDGKGMDLLTDVFIRYGWSATRKSIQRELENDLMPEELRLAAALREIWEEGGTYSEAFIGYTDTRYTIYHALSWPMALSLVRLFGGVPDLAEIEVYISNKFEHWRHDWRLHRQFPVFLSYLYHCVATHCDGIESGFDWTGSDREKIWQSGDSGDERYPFFRDYFSIRPEDEI